MPMPGLSRAQADRRYGAEIDARSFGVVANGGTSSQALTENTQAVQDFVTYLIMNHRAGVLPAGNIRINGTIGFSRRAEWGLRGMGKGVTRILQYADNIPIFDLGTDTASSMHSWHIRDMGFRYWNDQPAANTGAVAIYCSDCPFQGEFRNLRFENGYYGFQTKPGQVAPWGTIWDGLDFSNGLTGGAINWYGTNNAVPNNVFGRMQANCANMTNTVFAIRGYGFRIDAIEFLHNYNHQILMDFNSGSVVSIGAIKLEIGKFISNNPLFRFSGNCKAQIDNLWIGGGDVFDTDIPSGSAYLIQSSTSDTWDSQIDVRHLIVNPFITKGPGAGRVYAVNAGAGASIKIGRYIDILASGDIPLLNAGSSDTAERVTVTDQVTPRLSQDLGDADYTVTWRGPNVLSFQTPFTAPRTLNLPSDSDNLFNGQFVEVRVDGAINSANSLVVKCGATTLRTITADKAILRWQYRRAGSAAAGWTLTRQESLGDPYGPGTTAWLQDPSSWSLATVTATDSASGIPTAGTVRWQDGTSGTFSGTVSSGDYTGYVVTWAGQPATRTVTATGITYDAMGNRLGPTAVTVT